MWLGILDKGKILSVTISILLVAASLSVIAVTEPTVSASPGINVVNPLTIMTAGENIDNLLAQMTLEEKVGQIIQGFAAQADNNMPIEEARKLVQEYYVGSFMTCGIKGPENVANFMNQMQEWAENTRLGIPLLSAIDADSGFREIGGDPSVYGAIIFPMLMGMGATRDENLVREVASITAKEARAMGIHWDLAPVADVVTEPMWRRALEAFGDNADLVSEMVAAQVQGYQMQISGENYQENGVMATAKHFPGHGGVYKGLDSHGYPSRATYSGEVLENIHLKPFEAAIDNGVESIMTGHIVVEAIDNENLATLSEKVVTELLRENLGFNGIIISDALDMGPIIAYYSPADAALRAIKAGVDVLMVIDFESVELIENAIIDAVNSGEISENRIDNSVMRILNAKDRLGLFDNAMVDPTYAATFVGNENHWNTSLEAARKSITMLKNDNNYIPFSRVDNVLVTGYESETLSEAIDNLLHPDVTVIYENNFEEAVEMAENVDAVIVTTFLEHWAETNDLSEDQIDLVQGIQAKGTPMVTVSLEKPYDIASIPDVPAHLCAYEAGPKAAQAIAEVLFGVYSPTGRLPVSIPGTPRNLYEFGAGINYCYKSLEVSSKGVGLGENFTVSVVVTHPNNAFSQDFESNNGTPGDNYFFNVWQSNPSFEYSIVHSGNRSVKMQAGNGGGTIGINVASSLGYADMTDSRYFQVWVYDTQGNNTIQLRFKDNDGDGGSGSDGYYLWSTMSSVKNQWKKITWDLNNYPSVPNLSWDRISSIELYEWNQGTYHFDDIVDNRAENVKLYVDDNLVDSKMITLTTGENNEINFTYSSSESGVHRVKIDNLNPEIVAVNVSASSEYSRLRVPLTAEPNVSVNIIAAVMNIGSFEENENVKLYVDDNLVDSKMINLSGREAKDVSFDLTFTELGTYSVTIDNLEAQEILCMNPSVWIDNDNDGVMDNGEPTFLSIQAAIDNASNGDNIRVNPGTYDTRIEIFPIRVNKSVAIRSSGAAENTIVDAEIEGSAFRIEADNAVIDGFTIENGSADWWKGGIEIQNAQKVRVINNIIINNRNHGIVVWEGGHAYNEISGNTIENNINDGIYFWGSKSNTIDNNIIRKNGTSLSVKKAGSKRSYSGISLHWAWDTVIQNNTIENNAVHGIFLHSTEYQTGVIIQYNDIENNQDSGVWIGASSETLNGDNNNIVGNEIWGAFKENSPTDNFSDCWWGSSDGPSGSGLGNGDAVNANIWYQPYLTSRYEG